MKPKPKANITVVNRAAPEDGLTYLLSKLDLVPEGVVGAAAEQPLLYMQAADYRIACMHGSNQTEMQLESYRADRGLAIRDDYRKAGEKLTEANLEALLLLDPLVTEKANAAAVAKETDEYSKLLLRAFDMRKDCLQIIAGLVGREISYQKAIEVSKAQLNETRNQLRSKYPGRAGQ